MYAHLSRLGITQEVQEFFTDAITMDAAGNLVFDYGDTVEWFGDGGHRVPASNCLWIAGTDNLTTVDRVIICGSAMEAIAFLNVRYHRYNSLHGLLFLATGTHPCESQFYWIRHHLPGRQFTLVYGRDILGRVADATVAAGLRRKSITFSLSGETALRVSFRNKPFFFSREKFSLTGLTNATGYRFRIRTAKPAHGDTFLAGLLLDK